MHNISKIFFNLQKTENNVGLIYISDTDEGQDNMYLKLSTGGIGLPTPKSIFKSFDKYNSEDTLKNLFSFIKNLHVSSIIIYTQNILGASSALLIFVKLCKQLDLYCISFVQKPFHFWGRRALHRYNNIIDLLETDELCDLSYEQRNKLFSKEKNYTLPMLEKIYAEELNKLALAKFHNQIEKNTIWKNIKYFKIKEEKTSNVSEDEDFIIGEESTKDFEIDYYNYWASENL